MFYLGFDEISDIQFEQALLLIMGLLADTLREADLGLTDEQMELIIDLFLQKLPAGIQASLQHGFAV